MLSNKSYIPKKLFGAQWPAAKAQSRQLIRATAANGSSSVPGIYPTLSPWYPPEIQLFAQQELYSPAHDQHVSSRNILKTARTLEQSNQLNNVPKESLAEKKLRQFLYELAHTTEHDQRKYLETFALVEEHLKPLSHDPRYQRLYDGLKQLVDVQSRNPMAYANAVHTAKTNLPPEVAKELDAVVNKQAKLALRWLLWGDK